MRNTIGGQIFWASPAVQRPVTFLRKNQALSVDPLEDRIDELLLWNLTAESRENSLAAI
jgi:hypothetical protein